MLRSPRLQEEQTALKTKPVISLKFALIYATLSLVPPSIYSVLVNRGKPSLEYDSTVEIKVISSPPKDRAEGSGCENPEMEEDGNLYGKNFLFVDSKGHEHTLCAEFDRKMLLTIDGHGYSVSIDDKRVMWVIKTIASVVKSTETEGSDGEEEGGSTGISDVRVQLSKDKKTVSLQVPAGDDSDDKQKLILDASAKMSEFEHLVHRVLKERTRGNYGLVCGVPFSFTCKSPYVDKKLLDRFSTIDVDWEKDQLRAVIILTPVEESGCMAE